MDISGKVVVVTGGASGIGYALAREAKARGARAVAIFDLADDKVQSAAKDLDVLAIAVDVSDEQGVADAIRAVEDQLGEIDLYCSNAGVGFSDGPGGLAVSASNKAWETSWQVNVMAHIYAGRVLLPKWIKRGHGYFQITASAAGLLSQMGDAAYSATKHAAVAFAESLAITHGDDGIGVSVLCPQGVQTPMIENIKTGSQGVDGILSAEQVAADTLDAITDNRFLVTPHISVRDYMKRKTDDYDRWVGGMRKFRRHLIDTQGSVL